MQKQSIISYGLGTLINRVKKTRIDYLIWTLPNSYQESFYSHEVQNIGILRKILRKTFISGENSYHNYEKVKISLKRNSPTARTIIEIGAGHGRLLKFLEGDDSFSGTSFLGLDFSAYLISNKICQTPIHQFDITNPKIEYECDVAFIWAVLMYFDNSEIQEAISHALQIGKIVIIFELPNTQARITKIRKFLSESEQRRLYQETIWSF